MEKEFYDEIYATMNLEELALQAWRLFVPTNSRFWSDIYKSYHSNQIRLMASLCQNECIILNDAQAQALSRAISAKSKL